MGRRLHEIIADAGGAPARFWYGMPGYATTKNNPVICFLRVDDLMSLGLTERANLVHAEDAPDKLIASAWFLNKLDAATETRVASAAG